MLASRLDVVWDRAGDWTMVCARRIRGVVLPAAAPSVMEIRPMDGPSTTPPLLTITGGVQADGRVFLRAQREQMVGLPLETYEYVIVLTDAETNRPYPLLRGYVSMRDTVGDGGP